MSNSTVTTAWHGSGHPAVNHTCPRCFAHPGTPCITTGGTGIISKITGYHSERVHLSMIEASK